MEVLGIEENVLPPLAFLHPAPVYPAAAPCALLITLYPDKPPPPAEMRQARDLGPVGDAKLCAVQGELARGNKYEVETGAEFKELTAREAKKLIETEKPLILDVRTPNEFYSGYIPSAKLIPLQQLAERISEIEKHKEKPVLIYCRSGNRSVVAAEILIKHGFKNVYHIRHGIRDWIKKGFSLSNPL